MHADAKKLLSPLALVDVTAIIPQVALSLLRLCGSYYCKLVHLARAAPSNLAELFDDEARKWMF